MVHTQFIWSHGGNQVFLCGDFTGWIKYQPMVPVEGSSSTFSTICDLPPGLHKYKFLVDGIWRINEQQLFAEDEYGVNNIVLVKQPEVMPQTLIIDDGVPIMDIDSLDDHNPADGASTSSSVLPHELVMPLRAEDIEATRHCLSDHLSSCTVYDLIPDSGKVFALDANVSVEEAFLVMHEENLAVAPLWDDTSRQISGMLTSTDFILILMELQRNHAMVANNVLESSSISAWKEGKLQLQKRPLIKVDPDETLNAVAVKIMHNRISSVPVLNMAQDTACPQLLHVACLGGVLKHIQRHFEHRIGYLPLLQQPIGCLPVGSWTRDIGGRELLTLLATQLVSYAFRILLDEHISSVPVVDNKGALVNIFSRSDIISFAKGNVYARIQLDHATISQALQLVDKKGHPRFGICTRSDTLYQVITLLSNPGVRRVVVVEAATQRVLGLITLRDVFTLIFRDFH
ncbi:unnamed protein product [Lactuca virosa]|uniref:CBS domain-containing protein n=1 Tax=Lactuca virosa TaxID=75947 RepID=A0AAU9MV91_9ASTR|nr:unnamed protein product [Lactuca virosa]